MKVSLVIPFINETPEQVGILGRCLIELGRNARLDDVEILLIDNGSPDRTAQKLAAKDPNILYHRNKENTGVLPTFKQGYELATGDIICFIHSDVLLHEEGWDKRISDAFEADPQLGLAGLFGARGVYKDGGREYCQSNMLGLEWGKCDCHDPAALHHGVLETGVKPVSVFDGVGLFFRRETLRQLVEETDMFADWRALHHWYDRIFGCKVIDLGWHLAVIGIGFDHASGQTANASEVYNQTALKWLAEHGHDLNGLNPDQAMYEVGLRQWTDEFAARLPLRVDEQYNYTWNAGWR